MVAVISVIRRPLLWPTALRQAFVILRPGAKDYLHFRMVTQYGGENPKPTGEDTVQYLEWVRAEKKRLRAR